VKTILTLTFVIRLKNSFAARLLGAGPLPDEADEDVELLLSRSRRAELRADPGYRYVAPNMRFDYLGGGGSSYRMRLRVVRFAIGGGRFENLATSLGRAEHGPDELKEIYAGRWGIETAFRDLKHGCVQFAFPERKLRSGLRFAARTAETLPLSFSEVTKQDELHASAAAAAAV
jgi:hypothetical protein